MNKKLITLGLLTITVSLSAQLKNTEADTIRIGTIEDVNIRKTGNPNKAIPLSIKSNLTVMETPQPIAIITHDIIEQQQAKQLSDVLQNVNGMYITSSRGNSQDSFGGRGFALGNDNIFKNGSRVNSGIFPEVSGLERVEVLKGANAMLYGNTAAGGVINMITKKPRFDFGGSIGLNAGSWNSYKPTVDIYGPLTKNIAFRVNGAYEYAESFRDVVQSEKYYFNPSFLFNLSSKSQLIVEADYLKNNFTPDFGIGGITANDGSYSLNTNTDRSTFFGTKWQYQDVEQVSTNVTFNHKFNDNWSLNSTASYQNYTKDYFSTERVAWTYAKTSPTRLSWTVPYNKTNGEQNYGSAQVNLNGEFNTGSIGHKVLIGADADYGQTDAYTYTLTNSPSKVVYLDDPSTWDNTNLAMPDSKLNINNRTRTRRIGAYAQDFISLTKEFKVIAGLRWSYIENMATINTDFKTGEKILTPNSSSSDQALSPKLGLVYMPNDNLSVFATYTNSFTTNTGKDINQNALNPTTIDQYEVGVKKNLFGNALSFNVSLYQILYNKYYATAQFDGNGIANNDTTIKEYIGKMSSRGFEVDITGNPTKYLSIIGGFSYNHAVYKDTPDLPASYVEDQRLVRTPATTANLSVFYKFGEKLQGLKVGAGLYYVGSRFAGWNDTKATLASRNNVTRMFEVDPYTTASFSVGYDWKKFSIQGKLNNIFDSKSYNVHENYSVNPITPRNYYFTLTYKL
ncbi:TonB-dependent siderophore receptor [Chryseobacterium turcicum]|uniref:TonB-dependent siderophore receptor n=1 Tax=Chryseobacterium turcicum TaxID=2898076 RepID=A0A9Q3V3X8_9FLAO|nr:TonB-dependent siderophore receptor [Chryseobacterium turcicum]MCD1117707.1 TonB-dependent siderophore receptor [Chryseobacterium turcicum]